MDIDTPLGQLSSVLRELQAERDELSKKVSELDKAVSRLYHEIEVTRYSTVSGYKTLITLQGILVERRTCKDQLSLVRSAVDSLTSALAKIKKTRAKISRHSEQSPDALQLTLVKNL